MAEQFRSLCSLAIFVVVLSLLSSVCAILNPTPRPLEPVPGFQDFRYLASARGDTVVLTGPDASFRENLHSAGAVQPATGIGFAWGSYSGNALTSALGAANSLELEIQCGFDGPRGFPSSGGNGVFGCYIQDTTFEIACAGGSYSLGPPPAGSYFRLGVGFDHACALSFPLNLIDPEKFVLLDEASRSLFYSSITLDCWGTEVFETPGGISNFAPASADPSDPFVDVVAGYQFTCVRRLSGLVFCGGFTTLTDNAGAQISRTAVSGTVPGGTFFGNIEAGPSNWCGVTETNNLQCGGDGLVSALTTSSVSFERGHLSVGLTFVCYLEDSTKQAQCLRDNTVLNEVVFTGIASGIANIRSLFVVVGYNYACITDTDFVVTCSQTPPLIPDVPAAVNTVPCTLSTDPCSGVEVTTFSSPLYTCNEKACLVFQVSNMMLVPVQTVFREKFWDLSLSEHFQMQTVPCM